MLPIVLETLFLALFACNSFAVDSLQLMKKFKFSGASSPFDDYDKIKSYRWSYNFDDQYVPVSFMSSCTIYLSPSVDSKTMKTSTSSYNEWCSLCYNGLLHPETPPLDGVFITINSVTFGWSEPIQVTKAFSLNGNSTRPQLHKTQFVSLTTEPLLDDKTNAQYPLYDMLKKDAPSIANTSYESSLMPIKIFQCSGNSDSAAIFASHRIMEIKLRVYHCPSCAQEARNGQCGGPHYEKSYILFDTRHEGNQNPIKFSLLPAVSENIPINHVIKSLNPKAPTNGPFDFTLVPIIPDDAMHFEIPCGV